MDVVFVMNGSTDSNSIDRECTNLSSAFWAAYVSVYFASYYVLMPMFFICGLTGHILCLAAFAKEARKDSAYAYQVFVSVSQATEVVLYSLYVLSLKWWSGVEHGSAVWFRNKYFLVWFTARLATPLSNICITTSLLLSLCMALDRFWALYRPHDYKTWNHRRNRVVALASSVVLGVSTSLFAILRYQIVKGDHSGAGGRYRVVLDVDYASTTACVALSHARNVVRMTALISLIACNTINWKLFRRRVLKVGTNTGGASSHARKSQRVKVEAERTLFTLVIVESTLNALGVTALTAYFFFIFKTPVFAQCSGLLMIPLVDMVLNLTNMGKFYIVLAVDLRFRRMILSTFPWKGALATPLAQGTSEMQIAPVTQGR